MTFKSKRTITSMVAGAALIASYIIYVLNKRAPVQEDVAMWALTILIFIGISIITNIVIQILFHIIYSVGIAAKEQKLDDKEVERIIESESMEDEFDKIINLKASQVGYIFAGIGFIVALAGLAFFGSSSVISLHIMLGAFFIGNLVEGCISIHFYERGV